jgi:hypothetical protein
MSQPHGLIINTFQACARTCLEIASNDLYSSLGVLVRKLDVVGLLQPGGTKDSRKYS